MSGTAVCENDSELGNLVLSRDVNESIRIGDDVQVKVVRVNGGQVRLLITAPKHVRIVRSELSGSAKG